MTIEAGKFYKTRGGLKARIYATDCRKDGGFTPVAHGPDTHDPRIFDKYGYSVPVAHGAIFIFNGWHSREWWLDGTNAVVDTGSEFDLVSPWDAPPVVDWGNFPKHIVAVAMDEDGDWHGFSDVPVANNLDKAWYSSISGCHDLYRTFELYDTDCPEFSGDWRDSLAIRPGVEPYTQPFPSYNSNEPTPGPWRIGNGSCVVADGLTGHDAPEIIRYYGGHLVCKSATKGNLHLIAAAPELYEACKEAMAFIRHYIPEEKSLSGRLHGAVCSAEGIPF